MKRPILPLFAALSLTACATAPTIYQPAMGPRAVGYVEQRIEPGRYLVSFQGGPGAPATYVADLAPAARRRTDHRRRLRLVPGL